MRSVFSLIAIFTITSHAIAQVPMCNPSGNQQELNACAVNSYKKADAELNKIYKELTERLRGDNDRIQLLITSQKKWLAFRDDECNFVTSGLGSVGPMIFASCLEDKTVKRAAELKAYMTCQEGDLSCPAPVR